jgi:hypothetical protein
MKKIEDTLGLSKKALIIDYKILGSLRAIGKKYNISHGTVRSAFNRMKILFKKDNCKRLPLNENYFSEIQSNQLYWLGFLMADGCVHKNTVRLTLGEKDLPHLEYFKNDVGSETKITKVISKKQNPNWKDTISNSFTITSKKIVKDVAIFGLIPRKTFITEFPERFKNHKDVNIYCRGYVDGDGCFCWHFSETRKNRAPQMVFSIRGTESFLRSFNNVLVAGAQLPLRCLDKKISNNNNIGSLSYNGNNICAKIVNWLYQDITRGEKNRFLSRKMNIVKHILSNDKQREIQY